MSQREVDSLAIGLSDDVEKMLRIRLKPHIDRPTNRQLPENSGATKEPYTKEEAEKWIAEYEEAVSDLRRDDS